MTERLISMVLSCLFCQLLSLAAGTPLREGQIANIKPKGWLLEMLNRQNSGLTGHPEALSYPYNSCLWAGEISRNTESYGSNWWRYEQTAYYTDGLLRLGYLLGDSALIAKGELGIDYTIRHATADGRLGNASLGNNMWPMAVFFRAMQAQSEYRGADSIAKVLERHFLGYQPKDFSHDRNIVNIEGLLWTYSQTGNRQLLEMAKEAYSLGGFALDAEAILNDKPLKMHGVTCCEMLKLPIILYMYTREEGYLSLARRAMKKLTDDHLLPDGVPSSAEHLAGKNPIHSHETCDIVDFTWTLGYFLMATGEGQWADMIEKAVMNAGMGAITKDFRSLQYFSSVNQVIATGTSNNNHFKHGSTWMAYRPTHETECCSGNIHRLLPNYVSRMWLKSDDGEVVAALYGPSTFSGTSAEGHSYTITEDTDYPFSQTIRFRFTADSNIKLPLMLRIPGWCDSYSISINGKPTTDCRQDKGFVRVEREFSDGDVVELSLPMKVEKTAWQPYGVYFSYGPLVLSHPVATLCEEDTVTYANMNGKRPENPEFKCWSMKPAASWQYGLSADARPTRQAAETTGFPFDKSQTPLRFSVDATEIAWPLDEDRFTPELKDARKLTPASGGKPQTKTIELVPYGATELRVTVFPVTEK